MSSRNVVWSYPCPTCGVGPGTNCRTLTRQVRNEPHVERVRLVVRCERCGNWLAAEDADNGVTVCQWCQAIDERNG